MLYQGEPGAVKHLDTKTYWQNVTIKRVWVGYEADLWGVVYPNGWAEDSVIAGKMYSLKNDLYCDTGEARGACSCYPLPEYSWSLGPMNEEQERSWLECEHEHLGMDDHHDKHDQWWSASNYTNTLIFEMGEEDNAVSG